MIILNKIKSFFTLEDVIDDKAPVPSVKETAAKQVFEDQLHKSRIARKNRVALHAHMDNNCGIPLDQTLSTFVPEPGTK